MYIILCTYVRRYVCTVYVCKWTARTTRSGCTCISKVVSSHGEQKHKWIHTFVRTYVHVCKRHTQDNAAKVCNTFTNENVHVNEHAYVCTYKQVQVRTVLTYSQLISNTPVIKRIQGYQRLEKTGPISEVAL